jgi:DNA polymerase-3 subunit alpha
MLAVAFDTETSGLIYNQTIKIEMQPEVIEFYGCLFDLRNGKIKDEYECLIKPVNGLKLDETKLKTINDEMMMGKLTFIHHAQKIKQLIEKGPLVIGHNISFDIEMINVEMKRCQLQVDWPEAICTVEQSIHLKGYCLKLADLYQLLFNEKFNDAHRAKPDVMATIRVAVELFNRGDL